MIVLISIGFWSLFQLSTYLSAFFPLDFLYFRASHWLLLEMIGFCCFSPGFLEVFFWIFFLVSLGFFLHFVGSRGFS